MPMLAPPGKGLEYPKRERGPLSRGHRMGGRERERGACDGDEKKNTYPRGGELGRGQIPEHALLDASLTAARRRTPV